MRNCSDNEDVCGCLSENIEKNADYTKNLYDWNKSENALQIVDGCLQKVEALLDNALTYYGVGRWGGLRIAYISDLHLHHHLKYYDDNEDLMINDIAEKLSYSLEVLDAGKFNKIYAAFVIGDVSETPETTINFFSKLREKVKIPVYFVLGNHEYIKFPDVKSCVLFYKEKLKELQINVLHNEYVVCSHLNEKFIIFGGTGFAKYDNTWNADRVICCPNFTREDEIRETVLFETAYQNALNVANANKICFLCFSHYPVSACLNSKFEKEAIYFSGHNHCNEYIRQENKVLYADNQVGYENNNFVFKEATSGLLINPYSELNDGLYRTSVEDYLQFYRYLGESVGDGALLQSRCKNGTFYVVKRNGYYGFFIVSKKKDSKGISIVNGGMTKKLTKSTDISWICENFDIVLSKYLYMLLPLRLAQEKISKELRELGLDGTIHGLIVDVDFYHHVALNPVDGTMSFYYASTFGMQRDLNSFDEVIKSLEYHGCGNGIVDFKLLKEKYEEKAGEYLLGKGSNADLLEIGSHDANDISRRVEHFVSRKEGMYGVSRKISPLQRLFSGRVLRDFDLRLTETTQQKTHRKKLYEGRVFRYEGIRYQIIEDNGGDIVVAEELQKGSRSKGNGIRLSGERKKFAIEELKTKLKRANNRETGWID